MSSKHDTSETSKSLFDLPTRNAVTPTISIDSSTSTLSIPIRKQRFDDRSQTAISLSLKSHSYISSRYDPSQSTAKLNEQFSDEILKWTETQTISNIINSGEFVSNYGTAVYIEPSSIYIAIGTSKGLIVGFNYHQNIEFVLELEDNEDGSVHDQAVSSLAFSSDSTFMAAGDVYGTVRIWDLSVKSSNLSSGSIKPFFVILPITLEQRFTKNLQGHLVNTPVNHINFIDTSHSQLISSDISGLVFYHNGFKKFLKKYFVTQKILGKNDANISDIRYMIHGCEMLPIGSSHQITDQLGLVAIMTSNILAIVSLLSLNNPHSVNLISHFKIGKSKSVSNSASSNGCLSWYPCMKSGKDVSNARLAFAWNNVLTILELNNHSLPRNLITIINDLKDKDKAVPVLPISKTCRWVFSIKTSSVVAVKWLSSELLCVFVKEEPAMKNVKLIIFHYSQYNGQKRLKAVGQDTLRNINVSSSMLTMSGSNKIDSTLISFSSSLKILKHRFILMAESESKRQIFIGRSLSWADQLLNLLSNGDYSKALTTANELYNSTDTGQLVLAGLPYNRGARCQLIKPYLLEIMKESMNHIFGHENDSQEYYLKIYFDIISCLSKDGYSEDISDLLESVFEVFESNDTFFDTLERYTISGRISSLPPVVLKKLVEHFIKNDKGDVLTEILCVLDIKTLDIDLTIQLCNEYRLRDCLIYIWNYLLCDYATPLVDFINDISEAKDNEDCLKVYPYLSFILTGRQYPTDRFIDSSQEALAKESVCKILFSATSIRWPNDNSKYLGSEETIFPYLYLLLNFNSFEMLSTLNEFFEDTSLNGNKKLNRQYIIEALLDVFDANEFNEFDQCQLAIFVARNFPKYSQFIRLSESVLNKVINDLCSNDFPEIMPDCELALQCLLPQYEPDNDIYLLEKLKSAKFYNVLINIYRSEGRYSKVLEMWLEKHQQGIAEELNYDSLSTIFENSFQFTHSVAEKLEVVNVIKKCFKDFLIIDAENFIRIISKFHPSLHSEILNVKDDTICYKYLNLLFDKLDLNTKQINNLPCIIGRYISLLCDFEPKKVYSFVEKSVYILGKDREEFGKISTILKEKDKIEGLTILLLYDNKFDESLDELVGYMNRLINSLDTFSMSKFTSLLQLSMKICEVPNTYNEFNGELYLNEKMWLNLIENCVGMANNATENNLIHDFLNKCIHDCFRKINDTTQVPNEMKEKSFITILNKFLEDSSKKAATLSNIRDILQEVFSSYSYESEMLKVSLRMLNEACYKSMNLIKSNNIKGLSIKSKSCTSCDKIMWGPDISEENFVAWEDRQRDMLLLENNSIIGEPFDRSKYRQCSLVFFKCKHGYHLTCLENLGYKSTKECVICVP